jgi:hypothetical protein
MYQFTDIDITDSKRVIGYVHYLIALQNLDPICLDDVISEEHQPLLDEMQRVCDQIEAYLPLCEPHRLRAYVSCYAMLFSFGKRRSLDPQILNDIDFRILDAWMDGNDLIPDIEAYSIIGRHLNDVQSDLRSWYQRKQAEYYLEIDENGKFAALTPLDNYRILNGLAHDSIWRRYPYCSYSKEDVAAVNYSDNFAAFDTATLCEYYHFLCNYAIGSHTHIPHELALLDELSTRADLDPFDRQAYALDRQALLQPRYT